jgi:hypothetical protein
MIFQGWVYMMIMIYTGPHQTEFIPYKKYDLISECRKDLPDVQAKLKLPMICIYDGPKI